MAAASSAGALYRADAQGLAPSGIDGLRTGNGLGFSPDGRVMYLSDSHPTVQQVWAFDLGDDGVPRHRRSFIDMQQHQAGVVGADPVAAVDDAGLVLRFTPDGRLDRQLAVPAAKVAMCAFFGPRLDRLVVTTIRPAAPIAGWDHALAGAVFVLDPGCQGLADTPFAGGGAD